MTPKTVPIASRRFCWFRGYSFSPQRTPLSRDTLAKLNSLVWLSRPVRSWAALRASRLLRFRFMPPSQPGIDGAPPKILSRPMLITILITVVLPQFFLTRNPYVTRLIQRQLSSALKAGRECLSQKRRFLPKQQSMTEFHHSRQTPFLKAICIFMTNEHNQPRRPVHRRSYSP